MPHKGDVAGHVIEGAYEVLSGFDRVKESRDAMRAITLNDGESEVFARAALALSSPCRFFRCCIPNRKELSP